MKRHRFDPLSFVFGMIFLLGAGAAMWNPGFRWDFNAWLLPAAALFLGFALLASTLRSGTQDSGAATVEVSQEATSEAEDQ